MTMRCVVYILWLFGLFIQFNKSNWLWFYIIICSSVSFPWEWPMSCVQCRQTVLLVYHIPSYQITAGHLSKQFCLSELYHHCTYVLVKGRRRSSMTHVLCYVYCLVTNKVELILGINNSRKRDFTGVLGVAVGCCFSLLRFLDRSICVLLQWSQHSLCIICHQSCFKARAIV